MLAGKGILTNPVLKIKKIKCEVSPFFTGTNMRMLEPKFHAQFRSVLVDEKYPEKTSREDFFEHEVLTPTSAKSTIIIRAWHDLNLPSKGFAPNRD